MANLLSTTVNGTLNSTGRISASYNGDRYQMNFYRASASNWWITNDSDRLGIHLNNVGDKFYFATDGDFWTAQSGWLSTALSGKVSTSGGTLSGSLSFADVADNIRFQKGSNHLNLKDPWSNFHLYIPSGGIYSDATAYYFRNTSSTIWLSIESGNVQASSSLRAPIFYDSNDTAYYLDPNNSTTSLNVAGRMTGAAWTTGARNYSNEWIEFPNYTGLYSPLNGAHFYPNNGTYGSWKIGGMRNGWRGIEFDSNNGNVTMMIAGGSNESGFHNNSYGWQILWSQGTLYIGKGTYGGSNATVWDSSNAPRAAASYLMYYAGFTLNANTMDTNSTGFTYANNAPFYGPIARFSTGGGYDLWLGGSYNGGGNAFYLRTRDGDAGTFNAWREIITSGNIGSQSVNYATTAGTATSAGSASVATSAGSVDGLTLTSSANGINPNDVTQNQIGYNTSVSLYGQSDGGLYSSAYSSSWIHQIYGDFRTGQIAIRGKNSGTWQDWRYVLDDRNIGSYAVPYGNMTGSTGLNDNKLYLRTNGDNNHYLWNAADDWEELVYYNGTGFRIKGSTGVVAGYFTDSEVKLNTRLTVGNFPNSTTNTGEAWVGRANDRNTGTLTVQLGGNSASSRSFEVVDYAWSTVLFSVNSNNTVSVNNYLEAGSSLRAPIFYDSNDTGYYLDPNGTSNLNQISASTSARWGRSGNYWTVRPSIHSGVGYWTGTNGWGTGEGTWANAWKGGFSGWDIWGTGTDHPQGSGYVHAQGIVSGQHYTTTDGGEAYGWMMVGAADAITNRYWLRGKWGTTTSAWTEIMTSNQNTYAWNMDQWVRTTDSVSFVATTSSTFLVNSHSDNTKGYRLYNTSNSSVSAMFTNSSNQLVIAAGAFDQINLNKKVYVNGVALGVNVSPSATAGRIDASNDIVAYSSSDERLKYNITPIENAIDKVKSLTGVEFDWKPEYKHAHGYEGHDTGIIAQQVQEVIPSAVRTNDTGFLAVRYEKLIGLLIEANKELAARVEELEKKLG